MGEEKRKIKETKEEKKEKEKINDEKKREEKKYWKELEKEFSISFEDKNKREIAEKISDLFEHYARIIEEKIQGDTSLITMIESEAFNEAERKELYELMKKLMFLKTEYEVERIKEQDYERLINLYRKEWQELKKKIEAMFEKIKKNWLNKDYEKMRTELRENYFG